MNLSRVCSTCLLLFVLTLFCSNSSISFADDWPNWRGDAARTATTGMKLADQLHLQWTRDLPAPVAAWPEDVRLMFDAAYEPTVVGDLMYVASSQTNSVTCFDTKNGNQVWRFFANGPVRFAPTIRDKKLYFGCDDGCVYCLDTKTGNQHWQINAAPSARKAIGNDRFGSIWPVRGGPVVMDNKLYFTAGVWPIEGNFLYIVDLTSDANPPAHESITLPTDMLPQGYLSASNGNIFIPTGRGKVVRFDVTTKEFKSIKYDSRAKTDYHVTASQRWMFHGDKVVDIKANQTLPFALPKPVTDGSILYSSVKNRIVGGVDLANPQIIESKNDKGEVKQQTKYDAYQWAPKLGENDTVSDAPIIIKLKAADRLYGFQGKTLFAASLPSKDSDQKIHWSHKIDGTPAAMVAANDRLFVTTTEGQILSFGTDQTEPVHHKLPSTALTANKRETDVAQAIQAAKTKSGYCLVIGIEDGQLVEELLRQTDYRILVLEQDINRANMLRNKLTDAGFHAPQVCVYVGEPKTFSFPPYIAHLIVSENWSRLAMDQDLVAAIYNSLRPYGGTAIFDLESDEQKFNNLSQWSQQLSRSELTVDEQKIALQRVGALEGAGTWTDEYGTPANTLMSGEKLVKAPLGVLWFGGPSSHPSLFYDRHDWASSAIIVHGRMFIQGPQVLTAVDVYTGRILWQIPLKKGLSPGRRANWNSTGFHFMATDDLVYLVYEKVCRVLDTETGKQVKELKLPEEQLSFGRIRIWRDWLIVPAFTEHKEYGLVPSRMIAMDRYDGKTIWEHKSDLSFPFIAVGEEKLFVFEGLLAELYNNRSRKGRVPKAEDEKFIAAYDIASGERMWRNPTDRVVTWLSYSNDQDVVIASDKTGIEAWHGTGGSQLWTKTAEGKGFRGHPENLWDKVILWNDRIIDQRGPGHSYDISTGKPIADTHPLTGNTVDWEFTKVGHHCNYAIASEHLMTFRAASAAYLDLDTGGTSHLHGFRAGCRNSLIPAEGILNAPNFANGCICSYSLFTSLAMIHVPEAEKWSYRAHKKPKDRVRKVGINFGAPGDRLDQNDTLWLDYPSVGGLSPDIDVKIEGEKLDWFRQHATKVKRGDNAWVCSSGVEGLKSLSINLAAKDIEPRDYIIRMYFLEPADQLKDRVFSVKLGDKELVSDMHLKHEVKMPWSGIMKEFKVNSKPQMDFTFDIEKGNAIISGIEIVEQLTEE